MDGRRRIFAPHSTSLIVLAIMYVMLYSERALALSYNIHTGLVVVSSREQVRLSVQLSRQDHPEQNGAMRVWVLSSWVGSNGVQHHESYGFHFFFEARKLTRFSYAYS